MPDSEFTFACPECGQRISATTDYVGVSTNCPTCNAEFVVPPSALLPASQMPKDERQARTNPLLVPLICVSLLFVFGVAGGAFYFGRRSTVPQNPIVSSSPSSPATPAPATATATPTAEPTPTPPAESYKSFVREARRMVSAMETGIDFRTFHDRLTEISASAKEALQDVSADDARKQIAAFTLALVDAHDIWRYKLKEEKYSFRLKRTGSDYYREDFYPPIGDRWDVELPTLVRTYGFKDGDSWKHAVSDYSSYSELRIDRAIEKIFAYASAQFSELERR